MRIQVDDNTTTGGRYVNVKVCSWTFTTSRNVSASHVI